MVKWKKMEERGCDAAEYSLVQSGSSCNEEKQKKTTTPGTQ